MYFSQKLEKSSCCVFGQNEPWKLTFVFDDNQVKKRALLDYKKLFLDEKCLEIMFDDHAST